MAQPEPENPFRDDWYQQPQYLPDRSQGLRKLLWVVGAIVVVGILAGIGVLVWLFGSYADDLAGDGAVVRRSLEEKHAEAAAAFNSEHVGVGKRELHEISLLLDAMAQTVQDQDAAAFRKLVDADRLVQRIQRTGLAELTRLEAFQLKSEVRRDTASVWFCQRYKIVRVNRGDDPDEAVVYAFLWNEDDSLSVAIWIKRGGDGWKLYDWELLEYGVPETQVYAAWMLYRNDPRLDRTTQTYVKIDEADKALTDFDYDAAAEHLRRAESAAVLSEYRNDILARVGMCWLHCGRLPDALSTLQKISPPQACPAGLHAQTLVYKQMGRYQDALRNADQFEAALGFNPKITTLKADMLAHLGRRDEAADQWQRLLRFDPEDRRALSSLTMLLARDEKEKIAEHLKKLSDPLAAVDELARSCSWRDDTALLKTLIRFEREHLPGSPHTEFLLGLMDEVDGKHEAAAAHYRAAWEAEGDGERRDDYVENYLDAMVGSDQVVAGYEHAPDPTKAFRYLTSGYEDDEARISRDDLLPLIDTHLRRVPEDPWVDFYRSVMAREDDRPDEAIEHLRTALDKADDESPRDWWRSELATSLLDAGQLEEAYRTLQPPADAFQALVEHSLDAEDFETLRDLVKLHRKAEPTHESFDYYEALACQQEGDLAEAERLASRGYAAASDDPTKSTYRDLWSRLRLEAAGPAAVYRDVPEAAETFRDMANGLVGQERWSELRQLLDAHRAAHPDDAQLVFEEARLAWLTRDYESVAEQLIPWPAEKMAGIDSWQAAISRKWLFRSLLRVGRDTEAGAAARSSYDRDGDPSLLAVWHAHRKDVDALCQWMDEFAGHSFSLYDDEDVGTLVRGDPQFLPLRRQHPPQLHNYDAATEEVVLLLRQPVRWIDSHVRDAVREVVERENGSQDGDSAPAENGTPSAPDAVTTAAGDPAEVEVRSLPPASPKSDRSLLVRAGTQTLAVTLGSDPYNREYEFTDPQLSAALAEHGAWLAIDSFPADDDRAARLCARRLAAHLADKNCLAMYFGSPGRLVVNTAEFRELLRNDPLDLKLTKEGEYAWLYRVDSHQVDPSDIRAVRRGLDSMAAAIDEREADEEVLIEVELRSGHLSERHWLRLLQVERQATGIQEYVAGVTTGSRIVPEFRADERILVPKYNVLDWRYTKDGHTVRGRDSADGTE